MKNTARLIVLASVFYSSYSHSVEVTPLLGYRSGGDVIDEASNRKHSIVSSSIAGLIISKPYEKGKTLELYYSHQSSEIKSVTITEPAPATTGGSTIPLSIDYLHLGGTTPISTDKNMLTFMSGGLGFTYLSPDFTGLQSELRASFSIGLGLKWPLTDNIALRLETRGLATLFSNNSSLFCNGGCSLKVNGNFFIQGEVFAGVAVRF